MEKIKQKYLFHSPAKINLNLRILATLKNGYHKLETDMVAIDFWDEFALAPATKKILQKNYDIPEKEDLIWQAIKLLEETTKKQFAFTLKIKKSIPTGAGLGGGSGNAAAILFVLNQIFQLKFSLKELASLGKKLGADVPFFLYQKPLCMGGIGEKVIQTIKIPSYPLLFLLPDFQSNTKEIYQNFQKNGLLSMNTKPSLIKDYTLQEIKKISVKNNSLYATVLKIYPSLKNHLQLLKNTQPLATQMSGSGSSLFAIYENTTQRNKAYEICKAKGLQKNKTNFNLYKTQIIPAFNFFT